MPDAILNSLHRLAPDAVTAPTLVADDLVPFHADERRHVTQPTNASGSCISDELSVRENLEITVGMIGTHVHEVRWHERLVADDAVISDAYHLDFEDMLSNNVRQYHL